MTNRRWVAVAWAGFALVMLAIATVCAVLISKQMFGGLVGPAFLPATVIMILAGGFALLVAALMLPHRKTWRAIVVIAWCVVALTSPLFGIMFLLPWGVLLAAAPLVFAVLLHWSRG